MRQKLTLLLVFAASFVFAQKQIQPYILTSKDDKDKTKEYTLIIYASAKNKTNVTFTLRNRENKLLKYKDSTNSFKIFPFTKLFLKNNLKIALDNISNYNDLNPNPIGDKNKEKTEKKIKEPYLKMIDSESDNIYQYFQALINAVFEYDTEPIAGVLKYSLNTTINKKSIQGIDVTEFFNRQAKILRHEIINEIKSEKNKKDNSKNASPIQRRTKYSDLKKGEFIKYILKNKKIEFKEYYKTIRERDSHLARSKFKHYAINRLKELYNEWKLHLLLNNKDNNDLTFFNNYTSFYEKIKCSQDIITEKLAKNESNRKRNNILYDSINKIKKRFVELSNNLQTEKRNSFVIKNQIALDKIEIFDLKSSTPKKINLIKQKKNDIKYRGDLLKVVNATIKSLKSKITPLSDQQTKVQDEIEENKKLIKENLEITRENKKLIKHYRNQVNKLIGQHKTFIKNLPLFKFKIDDIEIDINDGFIEHITVVGKITEPLIPESFAWNKTSEIPKHESINIILKSLFKERLVQKILNNTIDKTLKFVNVIPIGFSSKTDFDDLHRYNLYHSEAKEKRYSMPISSVIEMYIQKHQNDRLNFSPTDQVVNLPSDDSGNSRSIELKKETSSKILSAKIYSDFLGFQEANPNGLIQIEIEKDIPLWTKRFFLNAGRNSNLGYVNYINFNFTWSRIENKVEELTATKDNTLNKVSFLDLIKYDNTSIGLDLNMLTLDLPQVKLRLETNIGGHYGRVGVRKDENSKLKDLGFFRVYSDFLVKIRPEERFGGLVSFKPIKLFVPPSEEISASSFKDNDNNIWLHQLEFSAFFTPSAKSDNRFFFRYRYTNNSSWQPNGFGEFQVGYLAYLKF